jgi:hypothetical protein
MAKRWLELKKESWENIFECLKNSQIKSEGNFWASIQSLQSQIERDMDEEYYRKQIHGLILILNEEGKDFMVSREYVVEKLNMILNGGIGFHPNVTAELDRKKNMNR